MANRVAAKNINLVIKSDEDNRNKTTVGLSYVQPNLHVGVCSINATSERIAKGGRFNRVKH